MRRIREILKGMDKPNGLYPNYLNPKTGRWGQSKCNIKSTIYHPTHSKVLNQLGALQEDKFPDKFSVFAALFHKDHFFLVRIQWSVSFNALHSIRFEKKHLGNLPFTKLYFDVDIEVHYNITPQELCNKWLYSVHQNSISVLQHSTQNITV